MVASLSGVAFAELDVFSPGVVKGIILRHLRGGWHSLFSTVDGILTWALLTRIWRCVKTTIHRAHLYWVLKVFLIMALPE